ESGAARPVSIPLRSFLALKYFAMYCRRAPASRPGRAARTSRTAPAGWPPAQTGGEAWRAAVLVTLPQVRYGLSVLLLEVFYTPGIDYLCRQVHRQLLRNELARFYHYRTRKCVPPRKLHREIQ